MVLDKKLVMSWKLWVLVESPILEKKYHAFENRFFRNVTKHIIA